MKAFTGIKEKAHQIAWETSKDYDPLLSKEAWCEDADWIMKNEYKHPLAIIDERLENGHYRKMPPYSYNRDVAFVKYMLGYYSKVDYEIAKAKYEMYNCKTTLCKEIF